VSVLLADDGCERDVMHLLHSECISAGHICSRLSSAEAFQLSPAVLWRLWNRRLVHMCKLLPVTQTKNSYCSEEYLWLPAFL